DAKNLEVHVGDSLVWSNQARTTHTATSDDDGQTFDTGNIEPGKSSTPIRFDKKGEFKYHCRIHGRSMSGTVVVGGLKTGRGVITHLAEAGTAPALPAGILVTSL